MRLVHVVRPLQEATKLDRKQFAVLLGLRAAAAVFVPLLVGVALGHPEFRWAGIAGFVATSTDKGGAYATRAKAFAALFVATSLTVFIGTLAGQSLTASVLLAFLVVTLGAIVRVFGSEAISIGTIASLMFLLADAQPEFSVTLAFERAATTAAGIAWAAFLALVVWPVRVFAPARKAVAEAFQALSQHAENLSGLLESVGTAPWHLRQQKDHAAFRVALDGARAQLAAIRGNSRGTSSKGAWLLGLLQSADLAFGRVISVSEGLEASGSTSALPLDVCAALETQLLEVARACQALAEYAVDENEQAAVPRVEISTVPLAHAINAATPAMAPLPRAQLLHVGELLLAIDQALETVTPVKRVLQEPSPPLWVTARAALSFDSVELRHALRVGSVVALSVAFTSALDISHGYWGSITILVVLQPHAPATMLRSVQRVGGTVLGALIAVSLTALMPDPHYLLPVCMVMAAVSVSVSQVNYALYSTLLTPTFVLLAQVDGLDWRLAGIRAATTTVAGVVALIASRVFWPTSERTRIGDELAKALGALRSLLREVATPSPALGVTAARARFGVAINNADVSFQRIVAEHTATGADLEPVMTMLLYMRRACWAALAVTTLPGNPSMPPELSQACDAVLEELEHSAHARRAPEPLTSMGVASTATAPLLQSQLDRVIQHLQVLHDAQTRLAEGPLLREA